MHGEYVPAQAFAAVTVYCDSQATLSRPRVYLIKLAQRVEYIAKHVMEAQEQGK